MTSQRVRDLLDELTLEEKADVITGEAIWTTRSVDRLSIPQMTVTDGPNGARGAGLLGTGQRTACIPAGSVLGATWDRPLLERLGALLGDEAVAKGANVLLAPTINLHRNPLGGRNFECYSEDPQLSGELAAALIRGVQSRGVATTPKHFVANDSEFERNTIDSRVDERTLREVYLRPFELAVRDGGCWGIMSAYNRLNGIHCSENRWLLTTVLREEWGFDGFVVSDWFATRSTAASIAAGQSLEMPGAGNWYGREKIVEAIDSGALDPADLDRLVVDMLTLAERTGAFDGVGGGEETTLDRAEDRALIREAAAAGTVLVRNNGLLPLDTKSMSSIAVIGPNARTAKVMGGGSATVRAYRTVSPLAAIESRLGETLEVRFAPGCDIDRSTPPLASPLLHDGLTIEWFAGHTLAGEVLATTRAEVASLVFFGEPAPGVDAEEYSFRASGTIVTEVDGPHIFKLTQCGRARILVNDDVVIDATEGEIERGDAFFGMGSAELESAVELRAGETVPFILEMSNRDAPFLTGVSVGVEVAVELDLMGDAVRLASECDVALVVVGTNDDWETEGRDRDQFDLPGDQVELIRRVAAVNDRTIVVVNTGGPHAMDWIDVPAATLVCGFGGQELGDALLDVLLGDVDPGGRMPTTIPARYEHSPAYLNYPGENSIVRYGEGLYIGHRWFDARHIEPAVPFGAGLSYATFEWSALSVSATAPTSLSTPVEVSVTVSNTSNRSGSEVVQIYVEPAEALVHRPRRELKAFAKVHLAAGASETISLNLGADAFRYFDPADHYFNAAATTSAVPAGGSGHRHAEPGWYVGPGTYRVVVARSSVDHVAVLDVELTGEEHLLARTMSPS